MPNHHPAEVAGQGRFVWRRRAGSGAADADPITTAAVKVSQHVATGEQPVADCEPEHCAGLRIIDGNAEAWCVDSQRHLPNA